MQLLEKDLLELAGWQVVKEAKTLAAAGSVSKASMEVRNDGSVPFAFSVFLNDNRLNIADAPSER